MPVKPLPVSGSVKKLSSYWSFRYSTSFGGPQEESRKAEKTTSDSVSADRSFMMVRPLFRRTPRGGKCALMKFFGRNLLRLREVLVQEAAPHSGGIHQALDRLLPAVGRAEAPRQYRQDSQHDPEYGHRGQIEGP